MVLLSSSSCPCLVLLSSSHPPLVLVLSSSCPLLVSCPPVVLLVLPSSWPRWRTLSFSGPPSVLLLLLVATFANALGPPGVLLLSSCHGCKPRVLLLTSVQDCLLVTCPRCGPLSPPYPGLVNCLATSFFLSPPPCLGMFPCPCGYECNSDTAIEM